MAIKILILEDDKERQRAFRQSLIGADAIIVEKADDAILELQKTAFDWLFLDHDLGGNVFTLSNEKSGFWVAKWLSENTDRMPANVILHSLNPEGRKNMKAVLPRAIECAFAWDKIKFE